MARTPSKNTVSKARLSKASAIVKKKLIPPLSQSIRGKKVMGEKALTVKSAVKAAAKGSKTSTKVEQQIASLSLSFQEFQKQNTLQIEQVLQKLTFYNKENTTLEEGAPIVNVLDEIKKIKMEVIDMNNNLFQVHKIVKDTASIMETRMNQLFVKISLLIIFIAIVLSFVVIWIQTNPS